MATHKCRRNHSCPVPSPSARPFSRLSTEVPADLDFGSLHQPLGRTERPAPIRKLSRCGSKIPEMEHSPDPNGRAPITFDSLRWTDRAVLHPNWLCKLVVRTLCELCANFVRTSGMGEESIAQGEDRISTLFPRGFGIFFGMTAPSESGEPGITVAER